MQHASGYMHTPKVHINTYGCIISSAYLKQPITMRSKPLANQGDSHWAGLDVKLTASTAATSLPGPTQLHPMANTEIKGANTFPTLHFSGGTADHRGAHIWKSVNEDVSIIHWVADLCGFTWCILKALGGAGKRKLLYVTAINWGPLSLSFKRTQTATVKGTVLRTQAGMCRRDNTKVLFKKCSGDVCAYAFTYSISSTKCSLEQEQKCEGQRGEKNEKEKSYSRHYPASLA